MITPKRKRRSAGVRKQRKWRTRSWKHNKPIEASACHQERGDGLVWRLSHYRLQKSHFFMNHQTIPQIQNLSPQKLFSFRFFSQTETEGKSLWACGRNSEGQLGIGNNTQQTSFVEIVRDVEVTLFGCGGHHNVYALGKNKNLQKNKSSRLSLAWKWLINYFSFRDLREI